MQGCCLGGGGEEVPDLHVSEAQKEIWHVKAAAWRWHAAGQGTERGLAQWKIVQAMVGKVLAGMEGRGNWVWQYSCWTTWLLGI